MKRERALRVPADDRARHAYHVERYKAEIGGLLGRLKGKAHVASYPPAYAEAASPKPMTAFVEQLKKYRPKVSPRVLEAAEYMLHFLYEEGRAADFLSVYEGYARRITNMDHHIHAAKVYVSKKRTADAMNALRTMTTKAWCFVEEIQVAPMQLWAHDDLVRILTPKFCKELLALPKGQR